MLKKISFMLLMSFLFPIILIAKTIVVDQNENGDYLKINDALNIAVDGDTIYVRAGIYNEQIIISKQITLYSSNYDSTILMHPGYCIGFGNNNVTVQGFTIQSNGSGYGIEISGSLNIVIKNNMITNCSTGVYQRKGETLIANNIISDNQTGISCFEDGKVNVLNNLIHKNSRGLHNNASMYVYNNIIINNIDGIYNTAELLSILYNCVWSNTTNYYNCSSGIGDISLDPNFCDYENSDFRLRPESPCIDSGHPSSEYNDPDSTRNDMGIYGGPYSWQDEDPVPVELSNFDAYFQSDKVILRWRTCTETDNFGFEAQRRTAMEDNFTKIGFIEGKGTTITINDYVYEDLDVYQGIYYYRLKQIDFDGSYEYSKIIEVQIESLKGFSLKQNYPNPFNPTTTISFELPEKSNIKLAIYNIIGKEIEVITTGEYEPGYHDILFDANNFSSGLYFYRLEADEFVEVRKLMVLK